MKPPSFIG